MSVQIIKNADAIYNDPEKYHRITERFAGPNSADGTLGIYGWDRNGTNALNAQNHAATDGSMSNKGIRSHTGSGPDDYTRWDLFNNDVGVIGAGLRFRVRIKATTLTNVYWHFGVIGSTGTNARPGTAQKFFGFRVDTAVDGKVYGVVKSGAGAESTVDLGLATSAAWRTYELRLGSSSMSFYVDGTLTGSAPLTHLMTVAGNYPATSMWIQTLGGGAFREVRITYLDLIAPTGY
jgi:hypothetical protein